MKFPIDWSLISQYTSALKRHEKSKKALKKPEIDKIVKEEKKAREALKSLKKEIASRYPKMSAAVKSLLTVAVKWQHVDTSYDYPDVDVRMRDGALLKAAEITDVEEKKTAEKILKELKVA